MVLTTEQYSVMQESLLIKEKRQTAYRGNILEQSMMRAMYDRHTNVTLPAHRCLTCGAILEEEDWHKGCPACAQVARIEKRAAAMHPQQKTLGVC